MEFPLTFEGVRAANLDRLSDFGHGNLKDGWGVAEWGCALGGECGELLNVLKKMYRGQSFDPPLGDLLVMASDEIADVYLYLDLLSQKLGINIERAVMRKFNRTSEEKGFPQRLQGEQRGT